MPWFSSRRTSRAEARDARVFREAQRRLELEIRAITHRNAAKGLLKSGATIRQIVRALDETTVMALIEALDGIATVTEHSRRKRNRLLDQLQASLTSHHAQARALAQESIERIGLGNEFKHAVPLIEEAEQRHREKIADFEEGWTAPAGKPWKNRRPLLFAILVALIGAAAGVALKSAADRLLVG